VEVVRRRISTMARPSSAAPAKPAAVNWTVSSSADSSADEQLAQVI
jgi:hypothetical protein